MKIESSVLKKAGITKVAIDYFPEPENLDSGKVWIEWKKKRFDEYKKSKKVHFIKTKQKTGSFCLNIATKEGEKLYFRVVAIFNHAPGKKEVLYKREIEIPFMKKASIVRAI